jgi:hypothetical protein
MLAADPFSSHIERLAQDREWTVEDVARAVAERREKGASRSSFIQARKDPRKLTRAIIESTAAVLKVEPAKFPEWRPIVIADALRLDRGNLDQVLANLRIIERRPTSEQLAKLPTAPKRRVAVAPPTIPGELGRRASGSHPSSEDPESKPHRPAEGASGGSTQ